MRRGWNADELKDRGGDAPARWSGVIAVFIAQAHSLAQQSRLAITLAWVAGYTNLIAILSCGHVVSHASGTTADMGRYAARGAWEAVVLALGLLTTFLVGAMVSGFTLELGRRRGWESIYVLPMVIEAVLLLVFAIGVEMLEPGQTATGAGQLALAGVASMAMGLQNATITRISAGVVRTTHVTGVLTDLGLELVQVYWGMRDRRTDAAPASMRRVLGKLKVPAATWRALLLATIFFSFTAGAMVAALIHANFAPKMAMFLPVALLVWVIVMDALVPIAEIEESHLVGVGGLQLPAEIGVYQLDREQNRKGRMHRLPNLLAWADRIPKQIRVVVLDLHDAAQVDDNAALELRALIGRFHKEDRHLVLSGVTAEHYQQMTAAGGGEPLDARAVCPDLELAIARGLNLLSAMPKRERGVVFGMTNAGV